MLRHPRSTCAAVLLALAVLAAPGSAAAQSCTLDYQRADNMWAAWGRADGNLGVESVTVPVGQTKVFVTDWKYEKQRNDGTNFYGSHLRIATNRGPTAVRLVVRTGDLRGLIRLAKTGTDTYVVEIAPGVTQQFKADLLEVRCPVVKTGD